MIFQRNYLPTGIKYQVQVSGPETASLKVSFKMTALLTVTPTKWFQREFKWAPNFLVNLWTDSDNAGPHAISDSNKMRIILFIFTVLVLKCDTSLHMDIFWSFLIAWHSHQFPLFLFYNSTWLNISILEFWYKWKMELPENSFFFFVVVVVVAVFFLFFFFTFVVY